MCFSVDFTGGGKHEHLTTEEVVNCSEVEVEEWLRRRRSGEEESRCIVTDRGVSRGWEASHLLVVDFKGLGWENLVMRTVGHCTIIKKRI